MSKKHEQKDAMHLGGLGAPVDAAKPRTPRRNGLHMGGFTEAAVHPCEPENKEAAPPRTKPLPSPDNKTPLDKPCGCSGS